jgi:hypothetical protein
MNPDKINEICEMYRQNGGTTWILYSAVMFPDCILIFHTMKYAEEMRIKYDQILRRLNLIPTDPQRGYPTFTSVDSQMFRGGFGRKPIIFDNSCFF